MKCLVWDFDNTLAYRDGMWTQSLCNVLHNHQIDEYDRSLISDHFKTGLPWHRYTESHQDYFKGLTWWQYVNQHIEKGIQKLGITDLKLIENLTNEFRDEYLRKEAWFLYPDTIHALTQSQSRGYDNMILSNHTPELPSLVEYLGITPFFKAIISSAHTGYEKPHPLMFKSIDQYGRYDSVFMIGDNYEADILGALKAGFNGIMVRKENLANYDKYSPDLTTIWRFID